MPYFICEPVEYLLLSSPVELCPEPYPICEPVKLSHHLSSPVSMEPLHVLVFFVFLICFSSLDNVFLAAIRFLLSVDCIVLSFFNIDFAASKAAFAHVLSVAVLYAFCRLTTIFCSALVFVLAVANAFIAAVTAAFAHVISIVVVLVLAADAGMTPTEFINANTIKQSRAKASVPTAHFFTVSMMQMMRI